MVVKGGLDLFIFQRFSKFLNLCSAEQSIMENFSTMVVHDVQEMALANNHPNIFRCVQTNVTMYTGLE